MYYDFKVWKCYVVGQCFSWLDGGLQFCVIICDLDWGIFVLVENVVGKVFYVWFDVFIGYILVICEWAK